jgi:hypothetical protein
MRWQPRSIAAMTARDNTCGGEEQVTTAVQFADDTEVVLDSMEKLSNFLQCMDVFARASGQQLNLDI